MTTNPSEHLLGNGDALLEVGCEVERIQIGYVGKDDIESMVTEIACIPFYKHPYYLPIAQTDNND